MQGGAKNKVYSSHHRKESKIGIQRTVGRMNYREMRRTFSNSERPVRPFFRDHIFFIYVQSTELFFFQSITEKRTLRHMVLMT